MVKAGSDFGSGTQNWSEIYLGASAMKSAINVKAFTLVFKKNDWYVTHVTYYCVMLSVDLFTYYSEHYLVVFFFSECAF